MKIEKILTKNASYQKFEVLKTNRNKRYRYGEFFVEGVRNINNAIKNGWEFSALIYDATREMSDWGKEIIKNVKAEIHYQLTPELMKEISSKEDTSEILAILKMKKDNDYNLKLSYKPLLALFDRASNHGNLGTIIRSCDSLGIEGLIMTGHSVDLYDPAVITASMGSFFNIPVVRAEDQKQLFDYIAKLKEQHPDLQLVGSTAHKQISINQVDFTKSTILMLGNETEGLCKAFKEACDVLATIPMAETSSASSFNVACAATVMFYEAIRQRKL